MTTLKRIRPAVNRRFESKRQVLIDAEYSNCIKLLSKGLLYAVVYLWCRPSRLFFYSHWLNIAVQH